jgi:hypothetical protein
VDKVALPRDLEGTDNGALAVSALTKALLDYGNASRAKEGKAAVDDFTEALEGQEVSFIKSVTLSTQVRGIDGPRLILRAHPMFHGAPWYDWVRVTFRGVGDASGTLSRLYACRILAIFNWGSLAPKRQRRVEEHRSGIGRTIHLLVERYTAADVMSTVEDLRSRDADIDLPQVKLDVIDSTRYAVIGLDRIKGPLWVTPRMDGNAGKFWVLTSLK